MTRVTWPSNTNGEFTLMFPMITQFPATNSGPNTMRTIAIESSARSGAVTAPSSGLVEYRRWAATMSK